MTHTKVEKGSPERELRAFTDDVEQFVGKQLFKTESRLEVKQSAMFKELANKYGLLLKPSINTSMIENDK